MQVRFSRSGAVPEVVSNKLPSGDAEPFSGDCWSAGGALRNGPRTHLVAWEWELASLALCKALIPASATVAHCSHHIVCSGISFSQEF